MIPNSNLLFSGAPLSSAFRSLGTSVLAKNSTPAQPKVPKEPGLQDLEPDIYQNKELAALAKYFNPAGF